VAQAANRPQGSLTSKDVDALGIAIPKHSLNTQGFSETKWENYNQ
jgi:hypothetical protein